MGNQLVNVCATCGSGNPEEIEDDRRAGGDIDHSEHAKAKK